MSKTSATSGSKQRRAKAAATARAARQAERRRRILGWVAVAVAAVVVVGGLYLIFRTSTADDSGAGQAAAGGPSYEVGSPGPGKMAPDFTLASTDGGQVSLSDYRGQTVLLYFHEGGGCQPCWDQIRDLENQWGGFRDAGVDELVTITTDPIDLVAQKMRDDGLSSTLRHPRLDREPP